MNDAKASARIEMRALIAKARAEKKWIYSNTMAGEYWWSPDWLEEENTNGRFLWGAINFELRDPQDRVKQAQKRLDEALADYIRIQKEVA